MKDYSGHVSTGVVPEELPLPPLLALLLVNHRPAARRVVPMPTLDPVKTRVETGNQIPDSPANLIKKYFKALKDIS